MANHAANHEGTTCGGTRRGLYVLVIVALLTIFAATLLILRSLDRMHVASAEIAHRIKVKESAEQILSVAKDSETGQRGFLLTGEPEYLQPYVDARNRAAITWRSFESFSVDPQQAILRQQIRQSFAAKSAISAAAIASHRAGQADKALANMGDGKRMMDRLRIQVARFQAHEARALAVAEHRSTSARRLATALTLVAALAFAGAGALMYAAVRRARADAGHEAQRASAADQRFKATFEQAGVGMMHIDREGRPILVNDAMCDMTGYSREEFVTATPESPAMPSNLFSNKARCDTLLGGEVDSYRHERLSRTKDGREIFLSSVVSSVRSGTGDILFLSAIISDQTDQHVAERNLRESQERLRRLQDDFAHAARVNDLGEMAAAIAHEVNQPLAAVTNYMSVANKIASGMSDAGDLPDVLQRASEQALRAGQIVKRMRGFVERTTETRGVEHVGSLIDSAIELTMLGSDRDAVNIMHHGTADAAQICVDAIQFQQVLIILMRNAIEAFATAGCAGMCQIDVRSSIDADAKTVIVDVSDNGPGLLPDVASDVFKPFVTSKPGNMGIGLSIARRLIDSHGGRLTMEDKAATGATFRITIPFVKDHLDQAA